MSERQVEDYYDCEEPIIAYAHGAGPAALQTVVSLQDYTGQDFGDVDDSILKSLGIRNP